ncbi:MAG: GH3 auxin-responsive promoter family protein [Atopobiaceae bacterium]|jgi:hypothetical protein|nr:GH3 auxin-responsive promoter family protein [Atopobiaceae bacterium]
MLERYLKAKVAGGAAAAVQLAEDVKHPREVNEELLFRLVDAGKDSDFGKGHHFDEIKSVEDFKRLVPLTRYDDYAGTIYEAMDKGDTEAISSIPIIHFNETSGTMGNPKGIPYSELALENHNAFGDGYLFAMAYRKLGPQVFSGRCINLTQVSLRTLKSGITYGAFSGKNMAQFKDYLPLLMTSPKEALFATADTDTRYLHMRYALADGKASYINFSFVSILLDMMRYVEDNWQMLVDDIERGTISPTVHLPASVRASLETSLEPDPERAAELRREFKRGFNRPIARRIWPDLSFLIGIAGAGFAPYTERLRRYVGFDIPIFHFGYIASEGLFSVPIDFDDPRSVLLPRGSYYEFLPLDEEDCTETLGIEDLEVGKSYEVIVTNLSGLFRYRIRDSVRCVGAYEDCPMIEFLSRIDQTVSMKGEKTTEEVLRKVSDRVAARDGFDLVDFSVYPNPDHVPARYEFLFELYHPDVEALDIERLERLTTEELSAGNPSAGRKIESNVLDRVKVYILQEQTNQLWRDLRVMKGTSPNQIKPVHIIDNPMKKRFFFELVDRELSGEEPLDGTRP